MHAAIALVPYLLFVVLVPEEGLLALGTDKVLHMPLLTESSDHPFFDGSSTSTTDGNAHFVVAPKAVQLALYLTSTGRQLDAASFAVEVIRVIGLSLFRWLSFSKSWDNKKEGTLNLRGGPSSMTARHLKQMYLPTAAAFSFSLHELHSARPAFLKKPLSVSTSWQSSHLKQPGCQLEFIALITRP